jgi:hypothetical protein
MRAQITSFRSQLLLCLFSFLLFSRFGYAQYSGNIQGVVSDATGAAIGGASVRLRNADTAVEATTITSGSGNYRFSSLPPGRYLVRAEAGGFQAKEINLTLSTSEIQGINITLAVGGATQAVTVTAEAPILDTDDSRIQATLPANTVRDLPQANRNLWDVLAVTPGVVGAGVRAAGTSPGGGNDNFGTQTPQLSANGRSYTGNLVMVDGMNVTSPIQNGNIILAPVPDAVQEASLQANSWDAENNLGSSILIQVTTKSGTNQFHGTGSLFFTNQDLQATPEFQAAVAPFSRKDLVGALGGPVIKNRIFFFSDFEKLWSKTPEQQGTQTFEAPEFVAWSQQNFPSTVGTQVLTQYPATFLHPIGVASLAGNYLLGPNGCAPGQTTIPVSGSVTIPCSLPVLDKGSFVFSPYYNALQYNFRVDLYASQKDRIYLSYYNDSFDQQQPAPRQGLQALDIMRNRYGQADYTHTFGPNLLWESGFAFASVGGANGQDANLKVPEINVTGQDVGFHIGGGWGPGEYRGPMYNWRSVLSWVKGKHSLKFGFDGGHGIEHGDFTPVNVRPVFNFNNLLDLAQDKPFNESVGAYNPLTGQPGLVVFGGQSTPFGFFAQDDWKLKSNLSLTLALRWDDFTNHSPWGNSGFTFSSLILAPGATFEDQVANASVQTVPSVFAHSMTNIWSPRIGLAWDPTKSGKWSVRGGIGVYHDWVVLGQSVDQTRLNPPGLISPTFTAGGTGIQPIFALAPSGTYPFNFPLPAIPAGQLDSKGGLVGVAANVTSLDRNLKAPMAVNYVVGVEHQLPWRLVAGASYTGSRSYNGLTGTDVNRCAGCATAPAGGGETITRPNTSFGAITYVNNANYAAYNGMILSLRGSASSRGSFQASYTLSHTKSYIEAGTRFDQDTAGQNFGTNLSVPDQNAYFNYYSDANWDVRQRFSFSGVYTLPGLNNGVGKLLTSGWEVSSIAVVQTGTPLWVIDNRPLSAGGDYNADGNNFDIPNAPTQNFSGSHSRQQYMNGLFKTSDFPAPPAGTEGNLARNIYRNPGLFQLDASVLKNNHIPWFGEQGNLQFRFDFLNLFNHVNLGGVDPYLGDANFGKVTTALAARQIQLGLRVSF